MTLDPLVFGHRLRHFRRRRDMTLEDLGDAIGRPAPYLSLVENGKRDVKLGQIAALAEAVGVSVAELLEDSAPDRRSDLEIRLERAQQHPVYKRLGLPHLKPTAKTPDDVLEHLDPLETPGQHLDEGGLADPDGTVDRQVLEEGEDAVVADAEEAADEHAA